VKQKTPGILPCTLMVLSMALSFCAKEGGKDQPSIPNLRAFAKMYGYVRYFHPSDEASRIDWERFTVYGVRRVKGARNQKDLKTALEELFLPVAPTMQIFQTGEEPEEPALVMPEDTSNLKIVAWQHKGVNFGRGNSPYISSRLNRESVLWTGGGSGVLSQGLDARKFRGKAIRLRAQVKTNMRGSGNQAQLWLRVDREKNTMGFFDNMDSRPIQADEWREYGISGTVDDDAVMIFFGAILSGNGQAWFDGFQLEVKGEDNRWESPGARNPGFEEGKAGKKPKFWVAQRSGYTYTVQETGAAEGIQCLLIENRSVKYKGKPFTEHPQIGDMMTKELGRGLSCRIPLALYSDASGTLGGEKTDAFASLAAELKSIAYDEMNADNEDVRLAAVILAWNVFQHFYPYFDVVDVDWDAELTNTLSDALQDDDEEDFFYTLSRMVAKLNDGHGSVMHRVLFSQLGLPIRVEWVENQLVVTASSDKELVQRGDIIVSIDGVQAKKCIEEAEKYISGSPQWKRVQSCRRFGYGKKGTFAELLIRRGKKTIEVSLERSFQGFIEEWNRPPIQELQDGVFYVNLDKAPWQVIQPKLDELAVAKGVIFDMRGYPNGNHEIICHLLEDKDTSDAWMQVPRFIYPDQENRVGYHKMGWHLVPKRPKIKGKVVFITDGRAISYAESFMSFVEHYKLGEIVGQPTAGANGNNNPFSLPGGYRVGWTGMRVVKHDGSQHHQVGIQPTVPVKRTLQGVIDGRDELLEKAVELMQ